MHKDRMRKQPRPVKIPSASRLANIALYYLSRYAASEDSLRKVLQNRIRKAAMRDKDFAQEYDKHKQLYLDIETIIEKHRKSGVLNDTAYAEGKVLSLRRSGKSSRAIQQKLQLKGIGKQIIAEALETDGDPEEIELKAALMLAKKKRLGPYRAGETDAARHKKDIAAMARAGFSLTHIRKILGGEVPDEEGF